jgi:hypothetical protein
MTIKERPILFSGPMVRALLDGSKTQTRRVMKRQPPAVIQDGYLPKVYWPARDKHMSSRGDRAYLQFEQPGEYDGRHIMKDGYGFECPHGQPGDRLWVRESGVISKLRGVLEKPGLFRHDVSTTPTIGDYWVEETRAPGASYNVAGCPRSSALLSYGAKACPSIHMPRWASRITLEVTGVRVERLQDISEQDAIAEGIGKTPAGFWSTYGRSGVDGTYSPRSSFRCLWESINGAESWDADPWVWVVEFKRVSA